MAMILGEDRERALKLYKLGNIVQDDGGTYMTIMLPNGKYALLDMSTHKVPDIVGDSLEDLAFNLYSPSDRLVYDVDTGFK